METKNPLSDDIRVHHGHNLRYFREKQNMELVELAKKVKISQEEIQKLEEMQRIDDETLKKMGEALDVSVDTIKSLKQEKVPEVVQNTTYNITKNNTNENNSDSDIEQDNGNKNDSSAFETNNITNHQEGLSSIELLAKSYKMMLKLERERNDKLQAIIEKFLEQADKKDKPSPEK